MDITPLVAKGSQIIQGYGDGGFRINNIRYEGAVLVLKNETIAWKQTDISRLSIEDFSQLPDRDVQILLFGTGSRMVQLPPTLRNDLMKKNIALEVMDSGAACRTFNILLIEDRNVAAVLLPDTRLA